MRDRLADHLLGAVAEDALGALVPARDDAGERLADDGIVGRVDDRGRVGVRLLRAPAFGDVRHHADRAERPTGGVTDDGGPRGEPPRAALVIEGTVLGCVVAAAPERRPERLLDAVAILGMNAVPPDVPWRVGGAGRQPVHGGETFRDPQLARPQIGLPHAELRRFENEFEPLLGRQIARLEEPRHKGFDCRGCRASVKGTIPDSPKSSLTRAR